MSSEAAEQLAEAFHTAYEALAPDFGYETRTATARPWSEVPEPNRSLMVAVAQRVLEQLVARALDHHGARKAPEQ